LPRIVLYLASVTRAFVHSSGSTAVFDLAAFGVGNAVAEAALVDLLIDFRAAYICTTSNYVYHCLLPAHQLTDNLIHQTLFNKRLDSLRDFHDILLACGLLASSKKDIVGKKTSEWCRAGNL
jgi:hypothetical protein